jgi:hypothetical protein
MNNNTKKQYNKELADWINYTTKTLYFRLGSQDKINRYLRSGAYKFDPELPRFTVFQPPDMEWKKKANNMSRNFLPANTIVGKNFTETYDKYLAKQEKENDKLRQHMASMESNSWGGRRTRKRKTAKKSTRKMRK